MYNILCISASTLWNLFIMFWFAVNSDNILSTNIISVSKILHRSIFCVIFGFLIIFTNWWIFMSRKQLTRMVNKLINIDNELAKMKVPVNLLKQKKFVLCFLIGLLLMLCTSNIVTYIIVKKVYVYKHSFMLSTSSTFYVIIWFLVNFHFTSLMWSVKLRYKKLNLYLRKHFINIRRGGIGKLNKVAVIHDELVGVSECINEC